MKNLFFGLTLVCLATARGASAQSNPDDQSGELLAENGRLPTQFSQRPLTVPRFTVVGSAGLAVAKVPRVDEVGVGISFGGAFGITDNFEVGLTLLPLILRPQARYGNPNLQATYRLLDGGFELGIASSMSIPTRDGDDLTLGFSLPMQIRGRRLRFVTGIGVGVSFTEPDPTAVMSIPLQLNLSLTEQLFGRVRSGLNVVVSSVPGADAVDRLLIPLGLSLGFTIPQGGQPLVDLSADFDWPLFLVPGAQDKVVQDLFTVGVSANFYFFL